MIALNNKELKLIDKATYEFSKKELAPGREENDKYPHGAFFEPVLEKAFELDFFHSNIPEEFGGLGRNIKALCIMLANICREDSSLGGILMTTSVAYEILFAADSHSIIEKIGASEKVYEFMIAYPLFCNPKESENFLTAEKKKGKYTISGSLEYLVLGNMAEQAIVPAKIQGQNEYSFFLINLNNSHDRDVTTKHEKPLRPRTNFNEVCNIKNGIEKSDPIFSLGIHACPAVDLTASNVNGELIGEEGAGAAYFTKMTDRLNVAAAAMSTGIMKGSFAEAFTYCRSRVQGGRKISDWSEIQLILANMAVNIKNAEMIVSRACQAVNDNEPDWKECSDFSALHIQDMACDLTSDGIQVMGGVGYTKDFGQEKRFRDSKHLQAMFGIAPAKKINYIKNL